MVVVFKCSRSQILVAQGCEDADVCEVVIRNIEKLVARNLAFFPPPLLCEDPDMWGDPTMGAKTSMITVIGKDEPGLGS